MSESSKSPLYLLQISIHGLIRGHDLELGRDADTGGQTKYVIDLVKALSEFSDVGQVDLVTRRVLGGDVSGDYAREVERLSDKARIVRIQAGPDAYVPKEQLWDHLDGFTDNLLDWLNRQPRMPDVIHAHYADAGYVGVRLSNITGIPLVFTGHSLGRDKRRRLLATGLQGEDIEERYNMSRRIKAEEEVLANARLVVTSTHNEVEDQYELYDYYDPDCMAVIPPGTDLKMFHPPVAGEDYSFARSLARFLNKPDKPCVLALSRPDERKNILTLLEAYGESPKLQKAANLVIVAGNREDIREMDGGAQAVLKEILLMIDFYDLYGKVALPKHHKPRQVPEIYRLTASLGGVFINPALTEPFGLTLLEAAASGLPVVATENGGPTDIIGNCRNGLLVDPLDKPAITRALLHLLHDADAWQAYADNGIKGVRKHYSWQAHAESYLQRIRPLLTPGASMLHRKPVGRRRMLYHDRAIFTDLDQSLLGDPRSLKHFVELVRSNRKCASFGIATGRRLDSALAVMRKHNIPLPDVLFTSLGTEIYYAPQLVADSAWSLHVDYHWNPQGVHRVLDEMPGLFLQQKREQSRFKVSYHYDPTIAPSIEEVNAALRHQELAANVVHAFGQFLDIIPVRASKGLAIRYFAQKYGIPLEHILVAGGSGADEDMIRGNTLAVVVANRHHEELSGLVDLDRVYFARQPYAAGILEAIDHYDFYNSCTVPEDAA